MVGYVGGIYISKLRSKLVRQAVNGVASQRTETDPFKDMFPSQESNESASEMAAIAESTALAFPASSSSTSGMAAPVHVLRLPSISSIM